MAADEKIDEKDRIENWKGKTVMVVTPHPDDDTFCCGGIMHLLAKNGNKVIVVIYTSDNAGSRDPQMTHARLAQIRKHEEEDACSILGIPKENIVWFGHDDGMLEYANPKELTKQMTREIRRYKPDAVFTIDPGEKYVQYHKSDHRAAAVITADAMRAANWRLYFPDLDQDGYKDWSVPVCYFYYSENPNYTVDIHEIAEIKARASAAHMSQFGDLVSKYDPNITQAMRDAVQKQVMNWSLAPKENGRFVEQFRRATGYGE